MMCVHIFQCVLVHAYVHVCVLACMSAPVWCKSAYCRHSLLEKDLLSYYSSKLMCTSLASDSFLIFIGLLLTMCFSEIQKV